MMVRDKMRNDAFHVLPGWLQVSTLVEESKLQREGEDQQQHNNATLLASCCSHRMLYVPVFIRRPIAKMPVTVGFCIIDLQRKHSTVIVSYTVNLGKAMNGCKRVSGRQTKEASRNFLMTFRESYQAIAWRNNEDDIQVLAAMVILQSYSKHYFCVLVYLFYYGV